jgi:hypothetical protein
MFWVVELCFPDCVRVVRKGLTRAAATETANRLNETAAAGFRYMVVAG